MDETFKRAAGVVDAHPRSLTDLIFTAARGAIDDSGQPMSAIDSVVLAAYDLVDGRSLSSMVTAPAAAAYLRDEIRFGDDGAGALAAAMTRLEAAHNRRVDRGCVGEGQRAGRRGLQSQSVRPILRWPVGLDESAVSSMRAQRWLERCDASDRARASRQRHAWAARNSRAVTESGVRQKPPYPLQADELPVWADFAVALVMSTESSGVRVAGMGQSYDPFHIGDRDLVGMPALVDAVGEAVADAGVALEDVDVIELDAMTEFDEALAVEALGLTPAGTGFTFLSTSLQPLGRLRCRLLRTGHGPGPCGRGDAPVARRIGWRFPAGLAACTPCPMRMAGMDGSSAGATALEGRSASSQPGGSCVGIVEARDARERESIKLENFSTVALTNERIAG